MGRLIITFPIMVMLIVVSAGIVAKQNIDFEFVLCEDIKNNLPEEIGEDFNIGEKIFGYLFIDNIENGNHKVNFLWYNPDSKLQESFNSEIEVLDNSYNIWSWLLLKDSEMLYNASFIGKWKVKIYIDDNYLTEKYFNVS